MGGELAFFGWLLVIALPSAVEGAGINLLRVRRKVRSDRERQIINRSVGHAALLYPVSNLIAGINILTRVKCSMDQETSQLAPPEEEGHDAYLEAPLCRIHRPRAIEAVKP